MKNRLKNILILVITTIMLFSYSPVLTARAVPKDDLGGGGAEQENGINPDFYEPVIETEGSDDILKEKVGPILGAINTVGIVCSVIMIIVIGIKYMSGSVEEKAEYKKTMTTYVIGAVLLFSGTTIPNIIYKMSPTPYEYSFYIKEGVNWCNTCDAPAKSNWKCRNGVGTHQYQTIVKYYCSYCDGELDAEERSKNACSQCK